MSQISDGVWNIIRSADGMKSEIKETVQSVYDKLSNPQGKDNGESSSHKDSPSVRNKLESGDATGAFETDGTLSDGEPNEPPGFGLPDVQRRNQNNQLNQPNNIGRPTLPKGKAIVENKRDNLGSDDLPELDNLDYGAPPGFSSVLKHKNSGDASDEDPDVPPGFGWVNMLLKVLVLCESMTFNIGKDSTLWLDKFWI